MTRSSGRRLDSGPAVTDDLRSRTLTPDAEMCGDSEKPPDTKRRRAWIAAAALVAVVAAVVGLVVLLPRANSVDTPAAGGSGGGDSGLSVLAAAALVTELLPNPDIPPPGFRIVDDAATPQVDGAPTDPLAVDRSRTYFACEVQADPPTPA